MAQFGDKIWFHNIGEEGINFFVKRMIRAISYITKSGIVRRNSRTKQTLSDAWESTNWKV